MSAYLPILPPGWQPESPAVPISLTPFSFQLKVLCESLYPSVSAIKLVQSSLLEVSTPASLLAPHSSQLTSKKNG